MDKKTFFKGIATGAMTVVICLGIYNLVQAFNIYNGNGNMDVDKKLNTIASFLENHYVEEVDHKKLEDGIYKGMVNSLGDPYTTYLSKEELKSFLDDTDGEFDGIGVEIAVDPKDKNIIIISPILDSPAAKAGILPGDKIIKVDGEVVSGEDINGAVDKIKGKRDSEVVITVYRESTDEKIDFKLKRELISEITVTHEMLENNIGYIKISQFKKKTYEQFLDSYNDLNSKGQKGLIIDVRNNPGGLFNVVGEIADELVPSGTYVYTIDKQGKRSDSVSDNKSIKIPLLILVNENSASASEILSGAVQDMGVGKLVGTQTFGKGLVQGLYPLADGSGLKITIQKYYTPKGVCIQGEGITPDYVVELPDEYKNYFVVDRENDTQFKKAVEVMNEQIK